MSPVNPETTPRGSSSNYPLRNRAVLRPRTNANHVALRRDQGDRRSGASEYRPVVSALPAANGPQGHLYRPASQPMASNAPAGGNNPSSRPRRPPWPPYNPMARPPHRVVAGRGQGGRRTSAYPYATTFTILAWQPLDRGAYFVRLRMHCTGRILQGVLFEAHEERLVPELLVMQPQSCPGVMENVENGAAAAAPEEAPAMETDVQGEETTEDSEATESRLINELSGPEDASDNQQAAESKAPVEQSVSGMFDLNEEPPADDAGKAVDNGKL